MLELLCHPLLPSVFLGALSTGLLFHFVSLGWLLFSRDPFADLQPKKAWLPGLLKILSDDVRYAAALSFLFFLSLSGLQFLSQTIFELPSTLWMEALLGLGVILLGSLFHLTYLKVLLIFRERIDFRFLQALQGVRPGTLLLNVSWWEWLFLTMPAAVFISVWLWSLAGQNSLHARELLGACGFLCLISLYPLRGRNFQGYPKSLQKNPLFLFIREKSRMRPSQLVRNRPEAAPARMEKVPLSFPPFAGPPRPEVQAHLRRKTSPDLTEKSQDWNILQICLESVGALYATTTEFSHEIPMPFLKELGSRSLSLDRHYSTSNCTVGSLFSLFTGLYPGENVYRWAGQQSRIPCWNSLLKEGRYERPFLVHPGHTDYWFPRGPCLNSGWEIHDYHAIPETGPMPRLNKPDPLARPEENAVDFLLERIRRSPASRPFYATYYSHLAHYPFRDHKPYQPVFAKEDSVPPSGRQALQGYLNNLSCLDGMLQRIVTGLEAAGKLHNTILLITSDHGQGFGQHPDCLYHSGMPYEEILRVPCLIHAPGLIAPQHIHFPTSHVDMAPTLLDLLDLHHDQLPLQGSSLFRPRKENYLFAVGWGGYHSALRTDGLKVSVDVPSDRADVFQVRQDPGELYPAGRDSAPEALHDLLLFLQYQNGILDAYNRRLSQVASLPITPSPKLSLQAGS